MKRFFPVVLNAYNSYFDEGGACICGIGDSHDIVHYDTLQLGCLVASMKKTI